MGPHSKVVINWSTRSTLRVRRRNIARAMHTAADHALERPLARQASHADSRVAGEQKAASTRYFRRLGRTEGGDGGGQERRQVGHVGQPPPIIPRGGRSPPASCGVPGDFAHQNLLEAEWRQSPSGPGQVPQAAG
jgi:hypothetical protein